MKVCLYIRVSTSTQTVENQEVSLRALAKSRDWEIVKVYKDEGMSGDKTDRPAFLEMVNDVKSGLFDCVLVFQLSRLGRSLSHIVSTIEELKQFKVGVYCLSEHISTMDDNPYSKVTLAIFGALAEVELGLIRERVRAGVKRAQDNGVKFGRPHVGFDIGRAIELRNSGLSLRKVAKQLSISPATLSNKLKQINLGTASATVQ